MPRRNRIHTIVAKLSRLPGPARRRALSAFFGTAVRFAGTAGIEVEELTERRAVLSIRNRRKVQNHIGSVHAAAMALLAESATGFLVGMNVPEDKLPLMKSMQIDYTRRATGDLRAVAELSDEDIRRIADSPKGEVVVPVTVTDATGIEPMRARMTWAWIPKRS